MHEIVLIIAKYFIVIPVLAWVWLLVKSPRPVKLRLIVLTAISAVLTIALVKIATSIHNDPRPFMRDGITPYFKSSMDNGFPSDHTVFATLFAVVIFAFKRPLGIALAALAVLIGISRVISGVHHGQDIAGGFLIAILGVAVAIGIERLISRWQVASTSNVTKD